MITTFNNSTYFNSNLYFVLPKQIHHRHKSFKWITLMAVSKMEIVSDYEDQKPLLIFYKSETTGLKVLSENLIEIAAVATQIGSSQVKISETTFSSLVKITRRIPQMGKLYQVTLTIVSL